MSPWTFTKYKNSASLKLAELWNLSKRRVSENNYQRIIFIRCAWIKASQWTNNVLKFEKYISTKSFPNDCLRRHIALSEAVPWGMHNVRSSGVIKHVSERKWYQYSKSGNFLHSKAFTNTLHWLSKQHQAAKLFFQKQGEQCMSHEHICSTLASSWSHVPRVETWRVSCSIWSLWRKVWR